MNDLSSGEMRGCVFAAYMIATWGALIAGNLALGWSDPRRLTTFALVAITLSLSGAPVAFTTMLAPRVGLSSPPALGGLLRISPLGVAGCFAVGAANSTLWSLAPLYAQAYGFSEVGIGSFMAIAVLGGALFQWPLGKWSDLMDRRKVMVPACLAAALAAVGLVVAARGQPYWLVQAAAFAFRACALPIYSLCVAHAKDRAPNEAFIEVSGTLLMTYGVGAVFGPIGAAAAMTRLGVSGVFVFAAAMHVSLALCALLFLWLRNPVPAVEKGPFVAVSPTTRAALPFDPRIGLPPSPETGESVYASSQPRET